MLISYKPSVYGVNKCTISCEKMMRGRGKSSDLRITINSEEYGKVHPDSNLITYIWTLAHELRHCNQSWLDNIRQLLPSTDDDHWWNESHNKLDREAEADAWALLDKARGLFPEKGPCGCQS